MHSKPRTQAKSRKSFQWSIASTTISFMQPSALEAAREGSSTGDCSQISPLPRPQPRRTTARADKQR